MRQTIQNINKRALAEATGISYSKLRKYASGSVQELTDTEKRAIYSYLISIAQIFNKTENNSAINEGDL